MSIPSSSKPTTATKAASRTRPPSASEIARSNNHFETWSQGNGCEQVSYADLPEELAADVFKVFDTTGRLPLSWLDRSSKARRALVQLAPPDLLSFLEEAYESSPDLFSDTFDTTNARYVFIEIIPVFNAWKRLRRLRISKEKLSEADFVANVYNVFRSPALQESTYRVQCSLSLPQPLNIPRSPAKSRILGAKTVTPDCVVLVPTAEVRDLSHSAKSQFKKLKSDPYIVSVTSGGSSFRQEATPCAQVQDTASFEFVSSVWEDKKPVHQLLEDAYRQNRMSTASAVRHLRSLRIRAPVFGLVWASGTVRAHVDWGRAEGEKGPTVLSAPFPGTDSDQADDTFHEFKLDEPSDILAVHFLIRNIDEWTKGPFCRRITRGVNDLVKHTHKYKPWKRVGDLGGSVLRRQKENVVISQSSSEASTVYAMPAKRTLRPKPAKPHQ